MIAAVAEAGVQPRRFEYWSGVSSGALRSSGDQSMAQPEWKSLAVRGRKTTLSRGSAGTVFDWRRASPSEGGVTRDRERRGIASKPAASRVIRVGNRSHVKCDGDHT
jgi:hypothetical protein